MQSEASLRARTRFICASLAVVAAWVLLLVAWEDAPFTLTFDDAYYYFGIARNISDGHGSTFDQINLTNGYHPLWMAICVIAFKLGLDDLAAARTLLMVQVIAGLGVALLAISTLVSEAIDGWPRVAGVRVERADKIATWTVATTMVLVVANPFVVKVFVNGMETGILLPLYAGLLLFASRRSLERGWVVGTTRRWRLGMGVLLAITFLARTDAALLIGCLGVWCVAELGADSAPISTKVTGLAEIFALPALIVAGYMFVNRALFGTPIQVSGLVKRAALDTVTIIEFGVFVVVAAALGRHAFRRSHGAKARRQPKFPRVVDFANKTGWFGAFCVLIVGYYNILQTQQWLWYYCPLALYGVIVFILAVADMVETTLRDAPEDRRPIRSLAPLCAIFVLPLLGAFLLGSSGFVDPNLRSIQLANRDAGVWIDQNLPRDAVLASWDAGVVGYFSHRRVVNIDGVVNSYEYYVAMTNGTSDAFLRHEGIGWVTNHGGTDPGPNGTEDPEIRDLIRNVYGPPVASQARVVYRGPFLYSGTTTGSAGSNSGTRPMVMYVYEIG